MLDVHEREINRLRDSVDARDSRGDFKGNEYIGFQLELMKLELLAGLVWQIGRLIEVTEGA
jgi:hypothetical protein